MINVEYIGRGARTKLADHLFQEALLTKSGDEYKHEKDGVAKVLVGAQPDGEIIKDCSRYSAKWKKR
jgi:hypothetical protein